MIKIGKKHNLSNKILFLIILKRNVHPLCYHIKKNKTNIGQKKKEA